MTTTIILTFDERFYNGDNTFENGAYTWIIETLEKWGVKYEVDKNIIKIDATSKKIFTDAEGGVVIFFSNRHFYKHLDFNPNDCCAKIEIKHGKDF